MDNDNLVKELMNLFMNMKKADFHNIIKLEELTHNEKLVLYLLHGNSVESKISLSELRNKIKLAPSTVTPIITSLEEKGLIERIIDKTDRRNIFLQMSPKGIEYTNKAHENLIKNVRGYIEYMGEEDTQELIRLLLKTQSYFTNTAQGKEGNINEKSI